MVKKIKKSEFMNAVKNVLPASIHQDLPNINVPKICDMVGVNYFLYGSVDQKNKESYDLVKEIALRIEKDGSSGFAPE